MVMLYRIVYPDELNHYGVKGMKWGVRRQEKRRANVLKTAKEYDSKLKSRNDAVSKFWNEVNSKPSGFSKASNRNNATKVAKNDKAHKASEKARKQLEKSYKKLKAKDMNEEMMSIGNKYGLRKPKRIEKGFKDAKDFSTAHARLEDMTRSISKDVERSKKLGTKILVPSDFKRNYEQGFNTVRTMESKLKKQYKSVSSSPVTINGKDYIQTLLQDKKTGAGYEMLTELKIQGKK